jgi:2-keto-3-deoxy-L-rhamnonate aldolase RhmA
MIEKKQAVESLEQLVGVEGVDLVQRGPSDYAMSIRRPGEEESKAVRDAERHVITTCLQAGVNVRAEIMAVEEAKYYLDLGVRHFSLGVDIFTLHDVMKDGGERLREAIDEGA